MVFEQDPDFESDIDYPSQLSGNVIIALLVGADGTVRGTFVSSTTLDRNIAQSILSKLSTARFNVPTVGGLPVMAYIQLEVVLRQEE